MFKLQKKITIVVNQEPFQNQQTLVASCGRFTFSNLNVFSYPFCKREIEILRRRKKIEKLRNREIRKSKKQRQILFFSVSPFRLVVFSVSRYPDFSITRENESESKRRKRETAKLPHSATITYTCFVQL